MQVLRGVEDQKAFDKGLNNTTTARGLMVLFEKLAHGKAVDAESDAAMIEILKRQQFNDGIPAGVPPGTAVAHKTGNITRIHHDAGIVFARVPTCSSSSCAGSTIRRRAPPSWPTFRGSSTPHPCGNDMKRFLPYAGIVSRAQAEAGGLSVAAATALLHRIAYVKQRLAITAAMFLPSTPEWEVKCALALHGWIDAEHASMLYARIAEMREPPPGPWDIPDPKLEAAFDEVLAARSTSARMGALYGAYVRPSVKRSLTTCSCTHALCDQPTVRLIRLVTIDEDRQRQPVGGRVIHPGRVRTTLTRWTGRSIWPDDRPAAGMPAQAPP